MTSVPSARSEAAHTPGSSTGLPTGGRRVLIASDKFKGSLTAAQVGAAVGSGLLRVLPDLDVVVVPVADGGDGTLAAALAAGYLRVPVSAAGPTGERVDTCYARLGDVAVVELADVCGLSQLPGGRLAPLTAGSRGTGEVIAAALDAGCRRVVVGIGGSAGTDGGAGMARALGARLFGADGREIAEGGAALADLDRIDLSALHPGLAGAEIVVACDVDNPLTGPRGAAAVYGPQKGAHGQDVVVLDAAVGHWADAVAAATGSDLRNSPGAGAAGGVGFAALALLGASLRPGIDLVLDLVGFHDQLRGAELVITGEGSLDEQTLHGKAPAGVATAAAAAGVPVVAVCGRNLLSGEQLRAAGIVAAYSLLDIEPDPARCMSDAGPLLERLAEAVAADQLQASRRAGGR
ncbi:glycerate kinase [Nakamurella sp. GG22]